MAAAEPWTIPSFRESLDKLEAKLTSEEYLRSCGVERAASAGE